MQVNVKWQEKVMVQVVVQLHVQEPGNASQEVDEPLEPGITVVQVDPHGHTGSLCSFLNQEYKYI